MNKFENPVTTNEKELEHQREMAERDRIDKMLREAQGFGAAFEKRLEGYIGGGEKPTIDIIERALDAGGGIKGVADDLEEVAEFKKTHFKEDVAAMMNFAEELRAFPAKLGNEREEAIRAGADNVDAEALKKVREMLGKLKEAAF